MTALIVLSSILFVLLLIALLRLVTVRRDLRRAAKDLRLSLGDMKNLRLLSGCRETSDLFREVNLVLEESQSQGIARRETERRMKELMSDISHDVRTPLTSLVGYVDALRDGIAKSESERSEFLELVARRASGLREYVDSMFLLARLEADEVEFALEPTDLCETVRKVLIRYEGLIHAAGIECAVDLPEFGCAVEADTAGLERVVGNLVHNAIAHGGSGGYLGVSVDSAGDGISLAVEDHGPGIPAERLGRLFERQRRGMRGKGTGFGLPIVGRLLGKMGGSIRCNSHTGMTRFVLTLARCKRIVRGT